MVTAERIGGADRYETAALISRATFPDRVANRVWVARGDLFADALAASYPAGASSGGPILLTRRRELPPAVREELERLRRAGTDLAYVAGDTSVVSEQVEGALRELGFDTQRIGGANRYETASWAVATAPDEHDQVAFVVSGVDFPDALAAGPVAFYEFLRMPVFLTTPHRLHPDTLHGLRSRSILEVVIVGGPAAVSERVRRDLEAICYAEGCVTTRRIGGRDRTETATLLADYFVERTGRPPTHVNLARGDDFADAVAGAPHGGRERGPVLLTRDPDTLGEATRRWLEANSATIDSIHVFGTDAAVSDEVMEEARQAATPP